MIYRAFLVVLFLVIAIGGGAWSVWLVLDKAPLFGRLTSGPWEAFPVAGTPEADPYSRARHVRTGGLALGPSEGIVLTARTDSSGENLRRHCTYRIEGTMPSARLWTLYVTDADGNALPRSRQKRSATHSGMIVFDANNRFSISVSPHPVPGNWIAVEGNGRMQVVLTLFDTPIAAASQLSDLILPTITEAGCDA
jgi:hypothetical protein